MLRNRSVLQTPCTVLAGISVHAVDLSTHQNSSMEPYLNLIAFSGFHSGLRNNESLPDE